MTDVERRLLITNFLFIIIKILYTANLFISFTHTFIECVYVDYEIFIPMQIISSLGHVNLIRDTCLNKHVRTGCLVSCAKLISQQRGIVPASNLTEKLGSTSVNR